MRPAAGAVLVAVAVLGSGCSVMPRDVGVFGQATVNLTTRFAPLAGRSASLCRDARVLREAAQAVRFDAEASLAQAQAQCRAQAEAERSLIADAGLLQAYGRALAATTATSTEADDGDLGALDRVVEQLGHAGGPALPAALRLARVVRDGLQADARRRLTERQVRAAHEPLVALVAQLREHARRTVLPAVDEAIAARQALLRQTLVPASAAADPAPRPADLAARWPLRVAQFDLLRDIDRLQGERRQLLAFDAAADALVAAHARLIDRMDHPDGPARAAALQAFVDRVRALRDAVDGD